MSGTGASRVSSTGIPAGKPAQAPPQAGAFTVEISGDDIEHFTQRGVKVWSNTTISFEVQRVDAGGGSSGSPPIAIAGPNLSFSAGSLVYLDGGQSADPDGDPLTFHWAIIDAPDAVLIADPSLEQISFTPVVAGVYSLRLTVSDGLLQGTDDVQIIVTAAENLPPTADAGPDQEVNVGTQVVLDGSRSSDPDDEAASLEFQWSVGATPGSIVVLSDPTTVSLRFTPTEPGKYVFGLSVSDGEATSSLDLVTVVAVQVIDRMDDMILVQEGVFTMGSDEGFPDEQPPHLVTLSSYWIDEFEVNTQQYESCTDAGGCTPAAQSAGCNSGMEDRGDHPINCVTWEQGQSYCGWAQKRLPTEAEWEKAARGSDERRFPWGDAPPSSGLLNYANNVGSTTPMGTYPDGLSFYGLHNMGGNVSEWTADFYDPDYYANSPSMDPLGPDDGSTRVARGASWTVGDFALELLTTSARLRLPLPLFDATIGFRCATDHVADGSKTVLPATTPEILIDNLGRALNNADETLYARLLHESFWFTENDVRGELVFRNGLEAESEIVQGIFDVFTFAFEFTLTDRSIEFGADHPPAFAGDPDGHPDDDWEVHRTAPRGARRARPFRGRVRMEALLEDGNGFHVDQMMTFKLVADGEDDLWRLVRWHNDPVSEGESWRLLKALFG